MSGLLLSLIVALVIVGIVAAIAYYIPFPAPLAWLKWALPVLALLLVLIWLLGGDLHLAR